VSIQAAVKLHVNVLTSELPQAKTSDENRKKSSACTANRGPPSFGKLMILSLSKDMGRPLQKKNKPGQTLDVRAGLFFGFRPTITTVSIQAAVKLHVNVISSELPQAKTSDESRKKSSACTANPCTASGRHHSASS
jgi:hypothetical protein